MSEHDEVGRSIEWWIWQLKGVGDATMERLDEAVDGRFERLMDESADSLQALLAELSVKSNVRAKIDPAKLRRAPERMEQERAALPLRTRILHAGDADYPARLSLLGAPPRFLYVRGHIGALHGESTLSIVGSRNARVEAIRQTRGIAEAVGRAGGIIVSGGAIGVDAAAHRGAIKGDAQTVAVLPGAVDRPKPAKNSRIFHAALERGCLVSEYPPGTGVRRYHFHRRNRLIAALGDWLLVVRAGENSGTMITARAAAELERPTMTMAGDMGDSRFAGCVKLMAAGAACVRDCDDVLRLLKRDSKDSRGRVDKELIERQKPSREAPRDETRASQKVPEVRIDPDLRARLGEGARNVLESFEDAGRGVTLHLDSLRRESGTAAAGLDTALLELELVGILEKVPGKNAYRLTN
ncbi:MAG: DNA-processing protein DprA [Myxococcota bacterium]